MNRREFHKLTGLVLISPVLFGKKEKTQASTNQLQWNRIATLRPKKGEYVVVFDGSKYMLTYIDIKKRTVDIRQSGTVETKNSEWIVHVQNVAKTENDGQSFYPTFCPSQAVRIQPEHQWIYLKDLYALQKPINVNEIEFNKVYFITTILYVSYIMN